MMLPNDRKREKETEKQKIGVQRSGKRQTVWERAPDAVWEGYLIDAVFLFLSFLFSLFSSSNTHLHIHKYTS